MSRPIRIALSKTYLDAVSRLPRSIERKTRGVIEKATENLDHPGLNYEALTGFRDPRVRSLRVDQAYRIIAVRPNQDGVLLFVWVDHHDEAYDWARHRRFEVNPASGALQVWQQEDAVLAEEAEPATEYGLFHRLTDRELMLAGVPEDMLGFVRTIQNDFQLERLFPSLPEESRDVLLMLAAGCDLDEALEQALREPTGSETVDPEDVIAALERPVSQASFKLVEGEEELEAMLDAPLEQWRTFLHPSQRELVYRSFNGPARVLGGAGTGKTVVLLHRAAHLLREVFTDRDDRILVTTFTKNLAFDLRQTLETLVPGERDRLDVQNLHAWAHGFYQRRVGKRVRLLVDDNKRRRFMEQAMSVVPEIGLSLGYLLDELDQVVRAHDCAEVSDYLRARRIGRGTSLGRLQRIQIWRVLEEYREVVASEGLIEFPEVIAEVTRWLTRNPGEAPYRSVLADEAQDMAPADLRLLRALVPDGKNDLFLVGDAHQRIYGHQASLSSCGIEIRGRSKRLRVNYRTTQQIRHAACAVLEGVPVDDLDGGEDTLAGYCSLREGPVPQRNAMPNWDSEVDLAEVVVRRWLEECAPKAICLAARTGQLVERMRKALIARGLDVITVEPETDMHRYPDSVRIATMHRMKGLEFEKVILFGLQEGEVPLQLPKAATSDAAGMRAHLKRERCLLYVAQTRARDELVLTWSGSLSSLLGPESA